MFLKTRITVRSCGSSEVRRFAFASEVCVCARVHMCVCVFTLG